MKKISFLLLTALSSPLFALPAAVFNGVVESSTGGFKFPDGTTQVTSGQASNDASTLTTGTLNDARLSSNVPLLSNTNTFSNGMNLPMGTQLSPSLSLGPTAQTTGLYTSADQRTLGLVIAKEQGAYLTWSGGSKLFIIESGDGVFMPATAQEGDSFSGQNSGSTETNLYSSTLNVRTLATNGDSYILETAGAFAGNTNNKRIKVKFGSCVMFDFSSMPLNGGNWSIRARVTRISASIESYAVNYLSSNATLPVNVQTGRCTEDLTTALTFAVTGTGTATADITYESGTRQWVGH